MDMRVGVRVGVGAGVGVGIAVAVGAKVGVGAEVGVRIVVGVRVGGAVGLQLTIISDKATSNIFARYLIVSLTPAL